MKNLKLRYYLRGLGIGILVTVLVIGIAGKDEGPMTDAQIRERALELGMVDAGSIVLSELQVHKNEVLETVAPESESQETAEAESTEETTPETESLPEESAEIETEVPDETETSEAPAEESTETSPEAELEYDTVTIKSGSSSYDVSKTLAELGIIEDAGDFDDFLCANGYSKSIRVGTFKIPAYADEEEIAKIITGKR